MYHTGDTFEIGQATNAGGTSYAYKFRLDSSGNATFTGNVRSNTLLETNSGSNGNEVIPLKIRNNAGGGWGAGTAVSMEFVQGDGGGDAAGAKIKCDRTIAYNGGSDNDAKLEFYTSNADAYVKALTIDSNQNIQMVGVVDAPYLRVGDTGGLPQYSGRFQVDGGAWFFKSNIEVGIGKDGSNYTLIGWNDSGDYGRVKTGNNEELKIQDGGGSTTFGGNITTTNGYVTLNRDSSYGNVLYLNNNQSGHVNSWALVTGGSSNGSGTFTIKNETDVVEALKFDTSSNATFAGEVSVAKDMRVEGTAWNDMFYLGDGTSSKQTASFTTGAAAFGISTGNTPKGLISAYHDGSIVHWGSDFTTNHFAGTIRQGYGAYHTKIGSSSGDDPATTVITFTITTNNHGSWFPLVFRVMAAGTIANASGLGHYEGTWRGNHYNGSMSGFANIQETKNDFEVTTSSSTSNVLVVTVTYDVSGAYWDATSRGVVASIEVLNYSAVVSIT